MRLGFGEILVVLVLALLFFGPSKLPQLGSSLGEALRGFKKGLNELHGDDEAAKPAEEQKALRGDGANRPAAAATPTAAAAEPKAPAK
jgi:sec-independent protein translocase protein TatA